MTMTLNFIGPISQTSHTIQEISVTTEGGDLTIYPNHAPMLATLAPNQEVSYTLSDGTQEQAQIVGGILHVERDGVTIILDT